MERGSDKHGRRLDEELADETRSLVQGAPTESRVEEHREQEPPAEGEPVPDALLTGDRGIPREDVLTHDEIEARTELARHLEPSVFPADRVALLASAERQNAPGAIIEALSGLPEGTFEHTEAVWEALGGRVEFRD
jgi:hypothetical protein